MTCRLGQRAASRLERAEAGEQGASGRLAAPGPEEVGEVGRAVVVLKSGHTLEPETLLTYLRAHLARYKVPKSIIFVDALPLTGAGKVDKRTLVEKLGS